jgi:dolichol-phosphate mannosyltransferase
MALSYSESINNSPTALPKTDSLVIVPTYNEAENLEPLVRRILCHAEFDVLVVDDNSPDGTGQLADALAKRYPSRVSVLHGSAKRGLALAYLGGFEQALEGVHDFVFQMDADFSHDPDDLPTLRAALTEADVALGSRYAPGGGTRDWPKWRGALSRGGSVYASRLLHLPLRDLTSGFKGFRRNVLIALDLSDMHAKGFAFQIEMTHRCVQRGFRVVEVPITFRNRQAGHSKMDMRIVVEALALVWGLRFDRSRQGVLT